MGEQTITRTTFEELLETVFPLTGLMRLVAANGNDAFYRRDADARWVFLGQERAGLSDFITASGANVTFSPVAWRAPAIHSPMAACVCLWAGIRYRLSAQRPHEPRSRVLEGERERAAARLAGIERPNVLIDEADRMVAFWRLTEPLTDPAHVRSFLERLTRHVGGDRDLADPTTALVGVPGTRSDTIFPARVVTITAAATGDDLHATRRWSPEEIINATSPRRASRQAIALASGPVARRLRLGLRCSCSREAEGPTLPLTWSVGHPRWSHPTAPPDGRRPATSRPEESGEVCRRVQCPPSAEGVSRQEAAMELVTHKQLKGDRLMPWGKATVLSGARGFVFLAGNTATAPDYNPMDQFKTGGGAVGDTPAQYRAILNNIKADLEALGSSLEYIVRMTFYVKGPFPSGGVVGSPNWRPDIMNEFFAEHCPKHCTYNNPPPSELIGVAALAHPDFVVEIAALAALP